MKTLVQAGKRMAYTNEGGSTIPSGTPVVMGNRIAIATGDILVGDQGELDLSGVHQLPKVGGTEFEQGDDLYWDAGAANLTNVATGNTPAGECFADAASGDTVANVKLIPGGRRAAHVAKLGSTTPLTAIGATFADEVAARTAVNQLRTDTEARLEAIEAKVDAVIGALTDAGFMAAS